MDSPDNGTRLPNRTIQTTSARSSSPLTRYRCNLLLGPRLRYSLSTLDRHLPDGGPSITNHIDVLFNSLVLPLQKCNSEKTNSTDVYCPLGLTVVFDTRGTSECTQHLRRIHRLSNSTRCRFLGYESILLHFWCANPVGTTRPQPKRPSKTCVSQSAMNLTRKSVPQRSDLRRDYPRHDFGIRPLHIQGFTFPTQ